MWNYLCKYINGFFFLDKINCTIIVEHVKQTSIGTKEECTIKRFHERKQVRMICFHENLNILGMILFSIISCIRSQRLLKYNSQHMCYRLYNMSRLVSIINQNLFK